ncbi:MAG: ATP-binding cassette domain-containing protein [Rhodospirillaceae bacterium]
MTAVAIRDLVFRWTPGGPVVLDVPELTLAAGEHVFLAGPSGSGKTSVLNLLGGLAAPEAGRVEVLGRDLARLPAAARDACTR